MPKQLVLPLFVNVDDATVRPPALLLVMPEPALLATVAFEIVAAPVPANESAAPPYCTTTWSSTEVDGLPPTETPVQSPRAGCDAEPS